MNVKLSKSKFLYGFIALWICSLLTLSAYFGLFHYSAIRPASKNNFTDIQGVYPPLHAPADSANGRLVYHIWYSDCGCSQITAAQLIEQLALGAKTEQHVVILVGTQKQEQNFRDAVPGYQARLEALHIKLYLENDEESFVKKFGMVGAPSVLIFAKESLLYAGGYAPFRPSESRTISLAALEEKVFHGGDLAAYPIFGCVMGKHLRETTDPFKLKELSSGAGS